MKFMSKTQQEREAYVSTNGGMMRYDKETMTNLLLKISPSFLELDERWVDLLLEVEIEILNEDG